MLRLFGVGVMCYVLCVMSRLVIGFITYGEYSVKYLPFFLPSLIGQAGPEAKIIYVDNTDDGSTGNREYIGRNFPQVELVHQGKNLGFGAAYNLMIGKAAEAGAKYFLALNPDMVLESGAIARMIEVMESDPALGSVSPKILRWDFAKNEKTKIIDSCGIILRPGLRFIDLGQGRADDGSFDQAEILGPSGAAALYRVSALDKIKEAGQCFDELFFMYKEDCDLAYRLKLAGFRSRLVSEAVVYHDRTAAATGASDLTVAANRRNKSRQVKRWSFLNQQIIFVKYWRLEDLSGKLAIVWYQLKILVFVLLLEQYLLAELWKLKRLCPRINKYDKRDLRSGSPAG